MNSELGSPLWPGTIVPVFWAALKQLSGQAQHCSWNFYLRDVSHTFKMVPKASPSGQSTNHHLHHQVQGTKVSKTLGKPASLGLGFCIRDCMVSMWQNKCNFCSVKLIFINILTILSRSLIPPYLPALHLSFDLLRFIFYFAFCTPPSLLEKEEVYMCACVTRGWWSDVARASFGLSVLSH